MAAGTRAPESKQARPVRLGVGRRFLSVPWGVFRLAFGVGSRRAERRLATLGEEERRIHHFVVRELPRYGKPMPPEHVAEGLGIELVRVEQVLGELERRLIFLHRPNGRDVVWAYPVTLEPTPHRLEFSSGERLWAA